MLTCKDVALELTQSIEGELVWHRQFRLRLHLVICKECRALKKQFTMLKEAAALGASETIPPSGKRDPLSVSPDFLSKLKVLVSRSLRNPRE